MILIMVQMYPKDLVDLTVSLDALTLREEPMSLDHVDGPMHANHIRLSHLAASISPSSISFS